VLLLSATAEPLLAQAAPLEADGAAALGVSLRRLGTTKRVLMIAAHPDDENTALLAELALGDGADVAYLSLTRGEGGQNLIGPELQEGLGLIRTEELLAARRLDGARQFFTRAYDFGFSKSAEETFRQWPRDTLLADVVEVIRRYRPDIVISVFSGTTADGHGHHQAAGALARTAFAAAADAARFPEHRARGLEPHEARYLFQALWRAPPEAALRLATGDLDPLFGRSRYQIAMQSRSRHRSQDMGRAEPPGPQYAALRVLAGPYPEGARSLFAGVDTTLAQHARTAGALRDVVEALLGYERSVQQIRASYNPLHAAELAGPLAAALAVLQQVELPLTPAFLPLRTALEAERRSAAEALRQAAGILVDVVSDTPHPVPGEPFSVAVTLWNGGPAEIRLRGLALLLPPGWTARPAEGDPTPARAVAANDVVRARFVVLPPRYAAPSEPYFLRAPRQGALYEWLVADSLRGSPFEPPPVRAAVQVEAGAAFVIERAAEFVDVDKAVGERRRPLLVVPPVNLGVEPRVLVVNEGDAAPSTVSVSVTSATASAVAGTLLLDAPAGWRVEPASHDVRLDGAGDGRAVRFTVTPPAGTGGSVELRARYESDRGTFDRGFTVIDYPHIRPHALFRDATVRVSAFPVAVRQGLRVGYVEGAGDDGAGALRQLGATVEILDDDALANGSLRRFDAIVAGIRAYEVRPALIAHNARFLDYARNGGTFIVQYNKYELVELGLMPFPASMARPHGRVTDPAAPVTLLDGTHPLLTAPNRIDDSDFHGWVHERGLYFLDSFDPRYTPLLAMADPGEAPLHGGLVAARVGSGWYVYTGLALFRQLPEGVPGAYRILANLVSLAGH
jgi:LmbE family N-acetylglucosaminyl deacetylase